MRRQTDTPVLSSRTPWWHWPLYYLILAMLLMGVLFLHVLPFIQVSDTVLSSVTLAIAVLLVLIVSFRYLELYRGE